MGCGARRVGSPFGQRTSALGVGDVDGDFVGVAAGVGEESSRRLGVGVAGRASMICLRPPPKMTTATTVVSAIASTPMITASRRLGDPLPANPLSAVGVGTTGLGSTGGSWRGSPVVAVDHREPSQYRKRPGFPVGSGYQPGKASDISGYRSKLDRTDIRKGSGVTSATFTPTVGDRQPPIATKSLEADLGARWILPTLVLRAIDHPDHSIREIGIEAHGHDLFVTSVAFYVVVQDIIEQFVRRQRVGVSLTRS